MNILAIETSCDETAAAVTTMKGGVVTVRSNVVASQIELHARFGGVVPNLAAREHERAIVPTVTEAMKIAQIAPDEIDAIAVTHGPGLIPALLVGVSAAKTLSYRWGKPLLGIHHIEGHIYANLLEYPQFAQNKTFPVLALVVSGGHTQLVLMRDNLQYEIIGQTLDDAVGEAFDKVARMLGLSYPGGPAIDKLAQSYTRNTTAPRNAKSGRAPILAQFGLDELPRPMFHSGCANFSFSGIKTSVLYKIKEFRQKQKLADADKLPKEFVIAMSAAFSDAVADVLITKTIKVAQKLGVATITIAGGVSANTQLRKELNDTICAKLPNVNFLVPSLTYCLDNAAMIAAAAHIRYHNSTDNQKTQFAQNWRTLDASAQLKM